MRSILRASRPGVSLYTLGCKLNQLETESIAEAFHSAGFTVLPWEERRGAAIIIINTCTVTSKAEQKARRVIRLSLREGAFSVIVTGCYAQLEAASLSAIEKASTPRRLFVVPGAEKNRLLDLPRFLTESNITAKTAPALLKTWLSTAAHGSDGTFEFSPKEFLFHSRPFLKVQDGCNRNCAYCRVPLARGKSRSLASTEALMRLKTLEKRGAAETVLTGVNIAQYHCPETGRGLGELLAFLLDNTESIALRLSSIEPEPDLFNGVFLDAVSHPRLRPHFHLSVQSGSFSVLAAMARPGDPDAIRKSAVALRAVKGDPFLACDIICGFPGETEEDFTQSLRLCEEIGFAWIHGFPFSPRPGTPAFSLKNRVMEKETERRLCGLLALSRAGRNAYVSRWIGNTVDAIALEDSLLTANYLRIRVTSDCRLPPGAAARCRITQPLDNSAFDAAGELVIPPRMA
jgi:threonylcarbamoyladenosine tRNA methylthiotransferase MtaB